jgi:hypothetical protein
MTIAEAPSAAATLRAERLFLLIRYDCYALSPAIWMVVRDLEVEIAWLEYRAV